MQRTCIFLFVFASFAFAQFAFRPQDEYLRLPNMVVSFFNNTCSAISFYPVYENGTIKGDTGVTLRVDEISERTAMSADPATIIRNAFITTNSEDYTFIKGDVRESSTNGDVISASFVNITTIVNGTTFTIEFKAYQKPINITFHEFFFGVDPSAIKITVYYKGWVFSTFDEKRFLALRVGLRWYNLDLYDFPTYEVIPPIVTKTTATFADGTKFVTSLLNSADVDGNATLIEFPEPTPIFQNFMFMGVDQYYVFPAFREGVVYDPDFSILLPSSKPPNNNNNNNNDTGAVKDNTPQASSMSTTTIIIAVCVSVGVVIAASAAIVIVRWKRRQGSVQKKKKFK